MIAFLFFGGGGGKGFCFLPLLDFLIPRPLS